MDSILRVGEEQASLRKEKRKGSKELDREWGVLVAISLFIGKCRPKGKRNILELSLRLYHVKTDIAHMQISSCAPIKPQA
jgi:hypothetical protein